eukprot:TRINITY_DN1158_c0_g1_i1.p1 TRINITY_DN1158_c0_g1~~TRINITY_DN1158_c0_g1_i1.p1  ORF type:complete len:176 (-),score=55.25 TRINITY_DN1158_c0_g1_i1:130-657(-)
MSWPSPSIDEIIPNLYLGNWKAASIKEILETRKITHILTVAPGFIPAFPQEYSYKVFNIADVSFEDIIVHFEPCLQFIDEALNQSGAIFVHCAAGISRSATIIIAYLMWSKKISYEEAHKIVKEKREIIFPNAGFTRQLRFFESMNWTFNGEHLPYLEWKKEVDTIRKETPWRIR